MNFRSVFMMGITVFLFPSCEGVFDDVYDEPQNENNTEFGFVDVNGNKGTVYIDATSYSLWTYIDFHTKTIDTVSIGVGTEPPNWDVAVHRYDAKTNGGSVLQTNLVSLDDVNKISHVNEDHFVSDVWSKIVIDMSGMMDGNIIYSESYVNEVLSKWLDVNTATMPPVYTLSGKVYLIKLSDNTFAAVRLSNYMNDASVKGFMTIDYVYPLNLGKCQE